MDREDVFDQLRVVVRQERLHYQCSDYMMHERLGDQEQHSTYSEGGDSISGVDDLACCKGYVVKSASTSDVMELQQSHPDPVPDPSHSSSGQTFSFWRQQMFDWACMVVDTFQMDRQAVAMSFNLLDRFIAKELLTPGSPPVTRDDYQLFSMVCLFIVVKIVESFPQKLNIQALVAMSRNFYPREVIEATELEICNALNWRLHSPSAIGYVRLYLELFPSDVKESMSRDVIVTATTLTEIAVSDSIFVAYKPSLVGLAATIHAARLDGISNDTILEFCNDLDDIVSIKNNEDFRFVYLQLEKLYCH